MLEIVGYFNIFQHILTLFFLLYTNEISCSAFAYAVIKKNPVISIWIITLQISIKIFQIEHDIHTNFYVIVDFIGVK